MLCSPVLPQPPSQSAAKSKERKAQYTATLEAKIGDAQAAGARASQLLQDLTADNAALQKSKADLTALVGPGSGERGGEGEGEVCTLV